MLIRVCIYGLVLAVLAHPAFGQGQLTTTVGVNSNETPGTFSSYSLYQPNQFLVGGELPSQIWTGTARELRVLRMASPQP